MGFNYADENWQQYHEVKPQQPIIVSEASTFMQTRGCYDANADQCQAYFMNSDVPLDHRGEYEWEIVAKTPWLSGIFIWTAFDYRGEPSPFSWPAVISQFGVMDYCGFPKDGYYFFKSWWSDETVLHIFPHWNWPDLVGQPIPIHCFSNCEEVEVFVNDISVGRKKMPENGKLFWDNVIYQPGHVEAIGYRNNHIVCKKTVKTTGYPNKIKLVSDRKTIKADGIDICIITVEIMDHENNVVPTADPLIQFDVVGGKILGTGNGNPMSHEDDKANIRRAFHGLCQVIIQSEMGEEQIKVSAKSEGLKGSTILLQLI